MLIISLLIARASRAYRFCPACLSLVAIELIARGPSAYRSSGVIDNAKVQHPGTRFVAVSRC
jgi:hypothetical protein